MNDEVIARLRVLVDQAKYVDAPLSVVDLFIDDLRAMLDAHESLKAQNEALLTEAQTSAEWRILYGRAEAVNKGALDILESIEFKISNNWKCPVCAGWNVGPNGETQMKHTQDCALSAVLTNAGRR